MMSKELINLFTKRAFKDEEFLRIGSNPNLSLFVGKDRLGRFSFDFRGKYNKAKIISSEVINVTQFQNNNFNYLRFALENPELIEYFATFCQDLLDSTLAISDDEKAYKVLRQRYFSWKKLFKPNSAKLSEIEIMGLIGEILFLRDYMFPKWGWYESLSAWSGPENTRKDFSIKENWYEVKAVSAGKESVRISSIEQLDGSDNGILAIFSLEKMSPTYKGIKINELVREMISSFNDAHLKELFMAKLELFGYDFSPQYDNLVFAHSGSDLYRVNEDFPRLKRETLPKEISRALYDIIISHLSKFRISDI